MYHYGNNYDDVYVNITSAIKLEWISKKYRVDNNNIDDTELEWKRKKYQVDNNNENININDTELDDNTQVFRLVIQAVLVMSQLLFQSICQAVGIMLEIKI